MEVAVLSPWHEFREWLGFVEHEYAVDPMLAL